MPPAPRVAALAPAPAPPPPSPVHLPEHGPKALDDGGIDHVPSDAELVAQGGVLFATKDCTRCHAIDKRKRGPALQGVTERRTPQWLARMIMKPEHMVRMDPVAKAMLSEHMCMMPDIGTTPEEALALIAFLGTHPAPRDAAVTQGQETGEQGCEEGGEAR